jgi:protein-tyrosine phosphatase
MVMKYISSVAAIYRLITNKAYQWIWDYYQGENMEVSRMDKHNNPLSFTEFVDRVLSEPSVIIEGIVIGNGYNSLNQGKLKEHSIKYVINATKEFPNSFEDQGIKYLRIPVMDWKSESMKEYFDVIVAFFDQAAEANANIFVHCYMGSSRSATAILVYLMKRKNMSLDDALALLKKQRPIVNINNKFLDEVKDYMGIKVDGTEVAEVVDTEVVEDTEDVIES